jgi:hypothetical protein
LLHRQVCDLLALENAVSIEAGHQLCGTFNAAVDLAAQRPEVDRLG